MKKLFAVALLLCMLCTCAFAESVPTLNWSDISEETQTAGQFTRIALADDLAFLCWIPSNMEAVDVSTIEAEVAPVEAYQVEGGAYTVSIYALQVPGVDEYLGTLEANGAELREIVINEVSARAFEQKDSGVEGVIIPVSDEFVLSVACTPVDGDEGWDQVKAVIFSSVQFVEEGEEDEDAAEEEADEEVDEDDEDDGDDE